MYAWMQLYATETKQPGNKLFELLKFTQINFGTVQWLKWTKLLHSLCSEPHQLLFVGKLLLLAQAMALWFDIHTMFDASLVITLKLIRFYSDQLCDCNLALVSLCRFQVRQSASAYTTTIYGNQTTKWQPCNRFLKGIFFYKDKVFIVMVVIEQNLVGSSQRKGVKNLHYNNIKI